MWGEVASLPVPPTPATLRGRVVAALPVRGEAPVGRSLRPFVIGGLLVAVAAAAAISLQLAWSGPPTAQAFADAPLAAASVVPEVGGALPESLQAVDVQAATPAGGASDVATPVLDPRRIVVLRRPEAVADGHGTAMFEQCLDAIVSQLRTVDALVVTVDAATRKVSSSRAFQLSGEDRESARTRGAGHLLVVTTQNGCSASLFDVGTGRVVMGLTNGSATPGADGWRSLASSLMQDIASRLVGNPGSVLAEARARFLDTSFGAAERLQGLNTLARHDRQAGRAFDKEVVAAAARLGSGAPEAAMRASIWATLRHIDDSQLIQPLVQSLAEDPDASVRMQAALTLNTFLDQPGVREALQRAVAKDVSSVPETDCCILTVREAAERALVSDEGFRSWVRGKLYDESLSSRSRLLGLVDGNPDGRFRELTIAQFGTDAQRVAFEIGRREQDPGVRRMAWDALARGVPDESFVAVILGDLANHPDEYVRSSAAAVLRPHASSSQVREAFQRALSDPSMEVRRVANEAIGQLGP